MVSAGRYMLMGKAVGSSSGEETVIVSDSGYPVDPHHFLLGRSMVEEYLKTLIKTHPTSMHSPFYSNPCSKKCKVCNMDKVLYLKVLEMIEKEKGE